MTRCVTEERDARVIAVGARGLGAPVDDDRPVLICFDGSWGAQSAIDAAGSLLGTRRAIVLTVWSSPIGMAVHGMAAAQAEHAKEHERRAARFAAEGCRLARDAGFDAAPLVARSDPEAGTARTIISIAEERDASLIVLGARGLSGLRSLLLGSVSHGVANRAHRPVLVVPATPASRT